MKIHVHDLDEGKSFELAHEYDPGAEKLDFVDLHYLRPITLTATIQKEEHCLFVNGVITAAVERMCSRCLHLVKQDVKYPVSLSISYGDEDVIDITDNVRELLIFDYPIRFLCSEKCKGLCPRCGQNKNLEDCDCGSRPQGGAFADLEKLL
jgi:uncharacterized protein